MKRRPLTTTSYAILGWLSLRSLSTYELAQLMRRGLRFFWPRAESQLYLEPKNLVAHGLAEARRGRVGRRPRTEYRISAAGRRALRSWMETAPAPPSLDFDGLVRVFFGHAGTPEALAGAARSAIAAADEIQARGREVATEFLEGRSPIPERLHLAGLTFDFLWSHAENLRRWGEATLAELARWQDCSLDDQKARRTLRAFRRALAVPPTRAAVEPASGR